MFKKLTSIFSPESPLLPVYNEPNNISKKIERLETISVQSQQSQPSRPTFPNTAKSPPSWLSAPPSSRRKSLSLETAKTAEEATKCLEDIRKRTDEEGEDPDLAIIEALGNPLANSPNEDVAKIYWNSLRDSMYALNSNKDEVRNDLMSIRNELPTNVKEWTKYQPH